MKNKLSKLVLPIFIETALVMMLGVVDTMMLSQHSDNAVAAVGVVNQLVNLAVLVFQVISFGTTVLCAQYLGAGLKERMVQATGVAIALNAGMGLVMSALLYFGCHWMLDLMGLRPELLGEGVSYMRIVGAFAFFQAIALAISASLRSADKVI
ncbi:MAG: MATE family efflux transporter, partial [Prevotella sp.]|nr:MATE family efflux transporter [Prevotella sp.]